MFMNLQKKEMGIYKLEVPLMTRVLLMLLFTLSTIGSLLVFHYMFLLVLVSALWTSVGFSRSGVLFLVVYSFDSRGLNTIGWGGLSVSHCEFKDFEVIK